MISSALTRVTYITKFVQAFRGTLRSIHHFDSQYTADVKPTNVCRTGAAHVTTWNSSADPHKSFYANDLIVSAVEENDRKKIPRKGDKLGFGEVFTDHMIDIDWDMKNGWHRPQIRKLEELSIHPASKALHYGIQIFEGMKAFRGVDGCIRLFRPDMNITRMQKSAARSALPLFDTDQMLDIITELIRLDVEWVPRAKNGSLYLRPTLIGTDPSLGVSVSKKAKLFVLASPCADYFDTKDGGVDLLADPSTVRAWPGGVGSFKMGCNYAPTVLTQQKAHDKNCQQVLWLSGKEQWITEAGTMNVFMYWRNENGEEELVTPSLGSGTILPGVTRQSVIDLARSWGEFKVSERDFTMEQFSKALKEQRVYEFFGTGTAAVVLPIDSVLYVGESSEQKMTIPNKSSETQIMQRIKQEILDIQYGVIKKSSWTREVA